MSGYEAEEEALKQKYGDFHSIEGTLPDGRTLYMEVRLKDGKEADTFINGLALAKWTIKNLDALAGEPEPESDPT